MKKLISILLGATLLMSASTASAVMGGFPREGRINDLARQIPIIGYQSENWEQVPDVAQYGEADWSKVVGKAKRVTVKEAMEIAESHPEITYFFFLKGGQMVLGNRPDVRVFRHGDAVFFQGEPSWGKANGLADGYIKKTAVKK